MDVTPRPYGRADVFAAEVRAMFEQAIGSGAGARARSAWPDVFDRMISPYVG